MRSVKIKAHFKKAFEFFIKLIALGVPPKKRRRQLREFLLERLDFRFDFKTHYKLKQAFVVEAGKRTALVVTHELSITGAPLMLLQAVKFLIAHDFRVMALSYGDGPLKEEFIRLGVPVCISRCYRHHSKAIWLMSEDFDFVVANTILSAAWVQYAKRPERLMWWLHESEEIVAKATEQPSLYRRSLREAKNVYAVSDYAASFVNRYSQASILHQGIEDIVGSNYKPINLQQKKLRVGVVGTFGERKNQLLMLEALNRLPENYQGKVEIVFVGHKTGGYFKKIKELSRPAWTIDFVGQISDPALKWPLFESIDLFFVPSIDEPFSLVVLEAMMLARPVAVSDRVGAKYLVDDKKNGFIFKSGDAEAVNKIIIWAIENRSSLREMGLIGRKTFSAKGSLSSFQNEFIMAVDSIVS